MVPYGIVTMSTTAIGASFSFTSPSRIQASQPGRTREVDTSTSETEQPSSKAAGTVLEISKAITAGSTVVEKTLVEAQEAQGDSNAAQVQRAAKAYGA